MRINIAQLNERIWGASNVWDNTTNSDYGHVRLQARTTANVWLTVSFRGFSAEAWAVGEGLFTIKNS